VRPTTRREFLQIAGLAASTATVFGATSGVAGGAAEDEARHLVPADKKLDPAWIESLLARGRPTIYRGEQLKYVGMPVGGICAGQLYLGGDGRLWHWDLFNKTIGTREHHYRKPSTPSSPLEQGFALRLTTADGVTFRSLDKTGFSDIAFRGAYPIGTVEYSDGQSPVRVRLEAFSPFIPLDAENSSLPATVMEFTVTNTSAAEVRCELAGWLENAVCLYTGQGGGARSEVHSPGANVTVLEHAVGPSSASDVDKTPLAERHDFGTLALALIGPQQGASAIRSIGDGPLPAAAFAPAGKTPRAKPCGSLVRSLVLRPGEAKTVSFAITWFFPNLKLPRGLGGRRYATRFGSAGEVAAYLAENLDRLASQTRLWRDTWYDSTLPYWFLERTFINASTLATSTCHWLPNGRFYGWEGVGCCEGTCTHVWHYAQSVARLFPQLERATRETVDFGLALDKKTGLIRFRGEAHRRAAVDGQAGCILRAYREHQMSAGDAFLRRNWTKIRKALEFLIAADADADGILEGPQHNTLDATWYGPVAWLSGMYLAALLAGGRMAQEMGDDAFAERTRAIVEKGRRRIVDLLWNGEYFVNRPDPKHPEAINSGTGCHVDQVLGQSWAWQVGLGRVFSPQHARGALGALWKYNFAPDVGPYRKVMKRGRWYAMSGEGGLIMCTFPQKDWSFKDAQGKGNRFYAGYFNECMNGFEYQVAGHMLWEGMLEEGLAIVRTIHDRYHPLRRNPFNEIECGDHYARSMASHGVFLAACGWEYHGPQGHLGFSPRLSPGDFRAAFTAAEGWGTISQKKEGNTQVAKIHVRSGRLRLRSVALTLRPGVQADRVRVSVDGKTLDAQTRLDGRRLVITLAAPVVLPGDGRLKISIGSPGP